MPKDSEGKTLGYAFIEYNTPQVGMLLPCYWSSQLHVLIRGWAPNRIDENQVVGL